VTAKLIVAAVARYANYTPLDKSSEEAARLADELAESGVTVERGLLSGGTARQLLEKLAAALEGLGRGDTLILIWTGHGVREPNGHYLAC